MNSIKEILKKNPNELSEEQMKELNSQLDRISKIEASRRPDILKIEDAEDIKQNIFTYHLGKSSRGKTGIFELKNSYSKEHFKNTLHFETRNNINYDLRKTKNQKEINGKVYLYDNSFEVLGINSTSNRETRVIDILPDNTNTDGLLFDDELDYIISKVEDIKPSIPIVIKYSDSDKGCSFNYKSFMKLYYDLADGKRLTPAKFKGLLFNEETGEELPISQISKIIKEFKTYLLDNQILGGVQAW